MACVKIKENATCNLARDKNFELVEITSAGICILEDERGQKFHVIEADVEYQGGLTSLNG